MVKLKINLAMLRKIKNKISALLLGSLTTILTACYGPPMEMHDIDIKTISTDNKPIEGLELILQDEEKEFMRDTTNSEGIAHFYNKPSSYPFVKISDIDSIENKEYKDTIININNYDELHIIKMTEK